MRKKRRWIVDDTVVKCRCGWIGYRSDFQLSHSHSCKVLKENWRAVSCLGDEDPEAVKFKEENPIPLTDGKITMSEWMKEKYVK